MIRWYFFAFLATEGRLSTPVNVTLRGAADGVARVAETMQWLAAATTGEPPPARWAVRGPTPALSLDPDSGGPWFGMFKIAYPGRLRLAQGEAVDVVVKRGRRRLDSAAAECVQYSVALEILYLELMAGETGVPHFYGGWQDQDSSLSYVVQRPGVVFGTCANATCPMSDVYLDAAKRRPLQLLRGVVAAYAAFAEGGGFFLHDPAPTQFVIDPATLAIYLIDAPRSFHSGLAELFAAAWPGYRRCDAYRVSDIFTMDSVQAVSRGLTCHKSRECPRKRKKFCVNSERKTDARCPPEAHGRCAAGRCMPLTDKSQVYDVAAQPWLFLLVLSLVVDDDIRRELAALASRMTQLDPEDRPTFSDVLHTIDAIAARW